MIDPRQRAEIDQARALASETAAALWKSYYEELLKQFTKEQAWTLLKIVVFATSGGKGLAEP